MSGLEQWLRQPDERDIVPVRGVVMRLAADEIRRLEAENARLKNQAGQAAAAAEPPAEITFEDGSVTRRLVWTGAGYALPGGAATLDDLLAEQAVSAPAPSDAPALESGEQAAAPEADAPAEPALGDTASQDPGPQDPAPQDPASQDAAPEDAAPQKAADPEPPAAAADADDEGGADEDDEDFELPPEWQ